MTVVEYLVPEGKFDATVQCYAPCRWDTIDKIYAAATASLGPRERMFKIECDGGEGAHLLLEVDVHPTAVTAAISECAGQLRKAGSSGDLIFLFDGAYEGHGKLTSDASQIYAFQRRGQEVVINLDLTFLESVYWAGFVTEMLAAVQFG